MSSEYLAQVCVMSPSILVPLRGCMYWHLFNLLLGVCVRASRRDPEPPASPRGTPPTLHCYQQLCSQPIYYPDRWGKNNAGVPVRQTDDRGWRKDGHRVGPHTSSETSWRLTFQFCAGWSPRPNPEWKCPRKRHSTQDGFQPCAVISLTSRLVSLHI